MTFELCWEFAAASFQATLGTSRSEWHRVLLGTVVYLHLSGASLPRIIMVRMSAYVRVGRVAKLAEIAAPFDGACH